MDEKRVEPVKRLSDLILTGKDGDRLLVDAFHIAMVREIDAGSALTLSVPVATGSSYSSLKGVEVEVQESLDVIAAMRAELR